tara:strand:+ start:54697 stop:54990 length:294 start_codon:yes stop_codon:yes gene_type:complete
MSETAVFEVDEMSGMVPVGSELMFAMYPSFGVFHRTGYYYFVTATLVTVVDKITFDACRTRAPAPVAHSHSGGFITEEGLIKLIATIQDPTLVKKMP